jgi:hypothetical protein
MSNTKANAERIKNILRVLLILDSIEVANLKEFQMDNVVQNSEVKVGAR